MLKGNYIKCRNALDESIRCIEQWKDLFYKAENLIKHADFHDDHKWEFEANGNQIFA